MKRLKNRVADHFSAIGRTQLIWWGVGFLSAGLLLFFTTLWMAGAVYSELPRRPTLGSTNQVSDVIVVLTGGRGRIRHALELFEKGYGHTLYISGTDRQVHMHDILKEIKWVGPIDETRIVLENVSTNTIENAVEARKYVEQNGFKKVLVVTSAYHARRAHYIFHRVFPPSIQLEFAWFEREPYAENEWWTSWSGVMVTVTEFVKFFYAWIRLAS